MTRVLRPVEACGGSEPPACKGAALDHALLRLQSWPDLNQMPADTDVRIAARVCALLARRPTVGSLIPRLLDQPRLEVAPVLDVLYRQRVIEVSRLAPPSGEESLSDFPTLLPSARFIAQLWSLFMR